MALSPDDTSCLSIPQRWDGRRDVRTRERRRSINLPREVGVLGIAVLAAELAPPADVSPPPVGWLFLFPLLVLLFIHAPGMARRGIGLAILDELRDLVLATTFAGMAVLSLRVLVADDPSAAAQTVRVWAVTTACLVVAHLALRWFEVRARERGERTIPTLILGAGKVGRLTAKRLLEHRQFGLRPIGFLDEAPLDGDGACAGLPVLGAERDLDRVVERYGVGRVVVAFSTTPHETLLATVRRCEELGVAVSLVPRLFEKMTRTFGVDHVGGLPLISLKRVDPEGWQFAIKGLADRIAAALLVVVLAPVLMSVALAVYVSAGRPLLYRQLRVGRDGRTFEMLKFRSMNGDQDERFHELPPDTAPGGIEGADRRTRVGRLLRRTSLDELPQLFNVLRGEMSLVGPRPERPEFVKVFERDVYRYSDRHRVKSGITGWAQIHGLRGQTSISDRVEWDNYYIENWSLWLDLKILIVTARAVFRFAAD
jgi:exopolysaccharide biosynthesis polyprenyl glycosylphosphotransferase